MYHSDSVGRLLSDLQQSSASLRGIHQELQDSSTQHALDKAIRSLVERSAGILQELLDSLENICRGDRGRKRDALRKTFLKFWNETKLKDLQGRLDSVRDDLSLYLTINLRTVTREQLETQEQLLIDMCNDIKDLEASAVPRDKEKVKNKEKGLGSQVLGYLTLGLLQEQKLHIKHDPEPSAVPKDQEKTLGWQVLDYLTLGLLQQQKRQMKHDLLNGIMANLHKVDVKTDPVTASTIQVSPEMREKLEQTFIDTLRYDRVTERESTVKEAHEKTFRWIFEDDQPSSNPSSGFRTWLETEDQLYWITGKAGSGKSTLMRYICQPIPPADGAEATGTEGAVKLHARCEPFLQRWAGSEKKLTVASFYFWAIGEKSQATQNGFFRCHSHYFSIEMGIPLPFDEDTRLLTEDELRGMFRQAVASISSHAKVALFVDGLDEFDGDCRDLITLLKDCTSSEVKVCVASRPWNEFSDAFGSSPSLKMEELTRTDITNYVETTFETDANFRRLRQRDTKTANKLAKSIVNKAKSVFVWVTVVVASLLAGMRDGDRPEDLETRLDLFPSELESLYGKIFDSIDPMYLEHAAQLFKLKTCIGVSEVDGGA
ncbi:hypothetical protein CEP54_007021 [Fusarium duplospermum]|uniref:Nephrocystin 3-like N-terminal domain-containing protein n=1 Tax=Fusarium duplospermum TaxID=1325734 RepID=A0A428Q3W0_9HYPO|nr:hypothetical protein CEP54_007021 [Fusarium duplospermum]